MQKIVFDESPKIEINGVVCELNIDSVEVYKKTAALSVRLDALVEESEAGKDRALEIIQVAKDLVITLTSQSAYEAIFPSPEAQDNWRWHVKACMGMLPVVLEARRAMVEDIIKNSAFGAPRSEDDTPPAGRKWWGKRKEKKA